jgi:hypothetical protein
MTRVIYDADAKHARRCGDCTLCCKLLPMQAGAYPPEHVAETAAAMIAAGWATVESFRGMMADFDKPAGVACQHQSHHRGCKVYSRRPFGCRYWNCRWLTGDDTADLRRPDRSRYVIDLVPDFVTLTEGDTRTNVEIVQIWVDSKTPDAWRDPALLAYIERRGKEGKAALIRFDNKRAIAVFPPSMSMDGQWHEFDHGTPEPQHLGAKLIEGLASVRNVKVGEI